jgi:hypothetical protein
VQVGFFQEYAQRYRFGVPGASVFREGVHDRGAHRA